MRRNKEYDGLFPTALPPCGGSQQADDQNRGARELRAGVKAMPTPNTASPDFVQNMSVEMMLDYLAVRPDSEKAAGKKMKIGFNFTDVNELYTLILENSTLNNRIGLEDGT